MRPSISLTTQDKQQLRLLLPEALIPKGPQLPIARSYKNHAFSAEALHFLERSWEQRDGVEATFQKIEDALASEACWAPLRDFYLRFLQRSAADAPHRDEALQKALQLCVQLAPHPTHALALALDWLSSLARPDEPSKLQLQWLLQRFVRLGWDHHLQQLLSALEGSDYYEEPHRDLGEALPFPAQASELDHGLPADATACVEAAKNLQAKSTQPGRTPEESRLYLLRAAELLSAYPELMGQAVATWQVLLGAAPHDALRWRGLFDAAVVPQRWELLGQTLQAFAPLYSDVILPSSSHIRLPLLMALEQGEIPHIDPLPLLLADFAQHPEDPRKFRKLVDLSLEKRKLELLPRLLCVHFSHLPLPMLSSHSMVRLFQRIEHIEADPNILAAIQIQGLAFFPDDEELLAQFTQAQLENPSHPMLISLLKQMALSGKGPLSFRLKLARMLSMDPLNDAIAATLYDSILEAFPHHLEAYHQARQLARRAERFDDVLGLYDREIEVHSSLQMKLVLMAQKAELMVELGRIEKAIEVWQKALVMAPQDLQVLRGLTELLETHHKPKKLLTILQHWQLVAKEPHTRCEVLRKIIRTALDSLQDHATAIQALGELLKQPHTLPECLDIFERLLDTPEAQMPLLHFLLEREDSLEEGLRAQIKLLIIRLMFRLLQFSGAQSRLQNFLDASKGSISRLQQGRDIAVQHNAHKLLLYAIERQLELLLARPTPPHSIASLYTQLGDLHHSHFKDDELAIAAYRNALAFAPGDQDTMEQLQTLLSRQGAFLECRDLLLAQAQLLPDPEAASVLIRAALMEFHKRKDHPSARNLLQRALELHPQNNTAAALLHSWEQLA